MWERGHSSVALAEQNPSCVVLGIDQSSHRLARGVKTNELPSNCMILRAELIDFWILASKTNWKLHQHYFLYPNPYPKKKHLKRRWYAHSIFPTIQDLVGEIIVRSNWKLYLDEWEAVIQSVYSISTQVFEISPKKPISLFEKKYIESGHQLWELRYQLLNKH